MPNVLTVFNHGTNSHSGDPKIALNTLGLGFSGRQIGWGEEDEEGEVEGEFIVNEGPGSSGGLYTPGQVNPFTGEKKSGLLKRLFRRGNETGMSSFERSFRGWTERNTKLSGLISGDGWDDNIARTLYLISAMRTRPDIVNMAGWSRGAVTCIRIANKLAEVYPDIRVNIFGYDPVAGGGSGLEMEDTRVIPSTVGAYVAILSMHDLRKTFSPQDMDRMVVKGGVLPGGGLRMPNVLFLPMPGKHNSQISSGGLAQSYAISMSLCWRFLTRFGSHVTLALGGGLGAREVLKHYSSMQADMAKIEKSYRSKGVGDRVIGGGFKTRDFVRKKTDYTQSAQFFINEHHRAVFMRELPAVYEYVFTPRQHVSGMDRAATELAAAPAEVKRAMTPYAVEVSPGRWVLEAGGGAPTGPGPKQRWSNAFDFLLG